jgi:hypothetical protein
VRAYNPGIRQARWIVSRDRALADRHHDNVARVHGGRAATRPRRSTGNSSRTATSIYPLSCMPGSGRSSRRRCVDADTLALSTIRVGPSSRWAWPRRA